MEKICGIYRIENLINHKIYIGLSKDCKKRWYDHRSKAFISKKEDDIRKPLYMAIRKWKAEGKLNREIRELLNNKVSMTTISDILTGKRYSEIK